MGPHVASDSGGLSNDSGHCGIHRGARVLVFSHRYWLRGGGVDTRERILCMRLLHSFDHHTNGLHHRMMPIGRFAADVTYINNTAAALYFTEQFSKSSQVYTVNGILMRDFHA